MGTPWCVLCGSEYVEGVVECVDCLVPLGDAPPLRVDEVGAPDEEQIAYELDDIPAIGRYELDRTLSEGGITHAWDGMALVVRAADEDAVDQLIDGGSPDPVLEEGEQLAYEISDWSDDKRVELAEALDQADLVYDWDDAGDLVVLEADEERVEAILDAIEFPNQIAADESVEAEGGDGLAAQDAMSELFVAADRLMHDPSDHEGVLSLVDAARMAEALPLPYGFAPAVWKDLVAQASALRHALEGDADDDEVIEKAQNLRTLLRQYV